VRVYEFISDLKMALDRANTYSIPNREVIVAFVAPNSGFCGQGTRPKYLGDNAAGEGRYGLNRIQIERLLESFDVTLPPEGGIR
jgi:hypothetical protein